MSWDAPHIFAVLGLPPLDRASPIPASVEDAIRYVSERGGGSLHVVIKPGASGFEADEMAPPWIAEPHQYGQRPAAIGQDAGGLRADSEPSSPNSRSQEITP